jgi:hypothetical protein
MVIIRFHGRPTKNVYPAFGPNHFIRTHDMGEWGNFCSGYAEWDVDQKRRTI